MRLSLVSLLPLALAAPTYPSLDLSAANAQDGVDALSDYFNLLAEKTRRYKALDAAPACELSRAVLPAGMCPRPPPPPIIFHKENKNEETNTLKPPTPSLPPRRAQPSSTSR